MAFRVTESSVLALLTTALKAEQITPWLEMANVELTERADANDDPYSDEKLAIMEKLLAAHLVQARDPAAADETTLDGAITYEGKTGLGLDLTRHGQALKMMDTAGIFQDQPKPVKSIIQVLGS